MVEPWRQQHQSGAGGVHEEPLVFRALREDEVTTFRDGLNPPQSSTEFSAAEAVGEGSTVASCFVHTTRDPEAAFYFAESGWNFEPSGHKIVAIDLGQRRTQAPAAEFVASLFGGSAWTGFNSTVLDLSTDAGRMANGLHEGSRPYYFARMYSEVYVRGRIHPDEIVATLDTGELGIGSTEVGFRDFRANLPHSTRDTLHSWAQQAKIHASERPHLPEVELSLTEMMSRVQLDQA